MPATINERVSIQFSSTPYCSYRIWIGTEVFQRMEPKLKEALYVILNKLSCWGGVDKATDDSLSWELPVERGNLVHELVKEMIK